MKVYLATDHAGYSLKEKIKEYLVGKGYDVEDCGAHTFDKNDDYPDFISKAAEAVSQNPDEDKGIIFGGSGQAEMMVANKFPGVRCALFYAPRVLTSAADATGRMSEDPYEMIRLTREHNNANMLSLGARLLTEREAIQAVEKWLAEPFPRDARHVRRIEKIAEIEKQLSSRA